MILSAAFGWARLHSDIADELAFRLQSGEALGAIADPATLEVLEEYSHDERPEVAETCQIASRRVRWAMEHGDKAETAVRAAVAAGVCRHP
jgi:deoxyhypusine monooxygenase